MSRRVEIQKGPIEANPETINQQTYSQRVRQAVEEGKLRRSGQTLTLHEPKTGKKR